MVGNPRKNELAQANAVRLKSRVGSQVIGRLTQRSKYRTACSVVETPDGLLSCRNTGRLAQLSKHRTACAVPLECAPFRFLFRHVPLQAGLHSDGPTRTTNGSSAVVSANSRLCVLKQAAFVRFKIRAGIRACSAVETPDGLRRSARMRSVPFFIPTRSAPSRTAQRWSDSNNDWL